MYKTHATELLLTQGERMDYYAERIQELETLQPFYDHLIEVHTLLESARHKGLVS